MKKDLVASSSQAEEKRRFEEITELIGEIIEDDYFLGSDSF